MVVYAPAQLISAPAQLITAPAQPPATGVVVYTALLNCSVLSRSTSVSYGPVYSTVAHQVQDDEEEWRHSKVRREGRDHAHRKPTPGSVEASQSNLSSRRRRIQSLELFIFKLSSPVSLLECQCPPNRHLFVISMLSPSLHRSPKSQSPPA